MWFRTLILIGLSGLSLGSVKVSYAETSPTPVFYVKIKYLGTEKESPLVSWQQEKYPVWGANNFFTNQWKADIIGKMKSQKIGIVFEDKKITPDEESQIKISVPLKSENTVF